MVFIPNGSNGMMFLITLAVVKTMSIDVFSPASGIPIQITLEDSSIAGATNYPAGRHSIYLGVTTLSNEWETIDIHI